MYRICIFLAIFCLIGCSRDVNTLIKSSSKGESFDTFGPFFLPAGNNFKGVSLYYSTKDKQKTSVRFSMVGEIDWLRENRNLTYFHKMIFENLEESAIYRFSIESPEFRREEESIIKTMPYGENFEFEFGIASIEQDLSWDKSPHFLILLSREKKVLENIFVPYYKRNKKILGSTIILPMFDLSIWGENFSISRNGIYSVRYKNLNLILIYNNFSDAAAFYSSLCNDSDIKNYVVVGNVSPNFLNVIIKDYSNKFENIFVADFLGLLKGVKNIDKPYLVKVTGKASFAIRK